MRKYNGSTVALALSLVAAFAVVEQMLMPSLSYQIISTARIEIYSYIIVNIIFSTILFSLAALSARATSRLSFSRILFFVFMIVTAGLLISVGVMKQKNTLTYYALSFIIVVYGFIVLVYDPWEIHKFLPFMLAILFIVPLPSAMLEESAVSLSKLVGRIAATLTDATYIERGYRVFLETSGGRFEVAIACSGVIGLSNVFAILPALLYSTWGVRSIVRRIGAVIIGLLIGTLIAFLGNIMRVSLIIVIANRWGWEHALKFFHGVPSTVYAAIAVVASFIVSRKIAGNTSLTYRPSSPPTSAPYIMLAVGLVIAIALGRVLISAAIVQPQATIKAVSYEYLAGHLPEYVFNESRADLLSYRRIPQLLPLVGASSIYGIAVDYQGLEMSGYAELADTWTRFHEWRICLYYQGYEVIDEWTKLVNGTVIHYLTYKSKAGRTYILAYAIFETRALIGEEERPVYIRISLMTPYRAASSESLLAEALTMGISENLVLESPKLKPEGLGLVITTYKAFLVLLAGYVAVRLAMRRMGYTRVS